MSSTKPGRPLDFVRNVVVRGSRLLIESPLSGSLLSGIGRFSRPVATIFMLHRFRDDALGNFGDNPDALRRSLSDLRKQGVEFLRLRDLVALLESRGTLDRPTAVFTVDDGYRDFASVGAPVFLEFDCPATVFITTDIAAGKEWFWWDKIDHLLQRTERSELNILVGDTILRLTLKDRTLKSQAVDTLVNALKAVDDVVRLETLRVVQQACEIDLPEQPPASVEALLWDDIRALEQRKFDFGPHSMSHPILSRLDAAAAAAEITGSWEEMKRQCADPAPVFCFPDGTSESFGMREIELVRSSGMAGAVTFERACVDPRLVFLDARYRLPRVEWRDDRLYTTLLTSGLVAP